MAGKKRQDGSETPLLVQRISDGQVLKKNQNSIYSFAESRMDNPRRYSYKNLFMDEKSKQRFRGLRALDLDSLVSNCVKQINRGKQYSLFALCRGVMLPAQAGLGSHLYRSSSQLKKEFDRYIDDDEFSDLGYTDVSGGPLDKRNGVREWASEISGVLQRKDPENLVFYLRQNPKLIAARILITIQDFYGGLTEEQAIEKYGQRLYRKMAESMTAVTMVLDCDGKARIPYSDLDLAYKKALGKKASPEEWD